MTEYKTNQNTWKFSLVANCYLMETESRAQSLIVCMTLSAAGTTERRLNVLGPYCETPEEFIRGSTYLVLLGKKDTITGITDIDTTALDTGCCCYSDMSSAKLGLRVSSLPCKRSARSMDLYLNRCCG